MAETDTKTAEEQAERISSSREEKVEDADPEKSVGIEKEVVKHAEDADEAMKAFAEAGPIVLTAEDNKRLLKIIDWNLMPLMCVVYGLNYLDKTTLSYASVMGLREDIKLVDDNYQWLGSMFYFGYLAWEYPTSVLLQRLPLAKYSAFCIVSWGLILTLFSVVHNFPGAVAVRFLLGVFEAAVTPGFALITSQWYTKHEQATRINIWFSFNGFAQIFGGLVAYGIAVGSRTLGTAIAPWKTIFLVTGLLTVSLGVWFFWLIPDSQLNARWLKKEDRILAVERVRVNQQGIGNKHFKVYQFKEALMDPMTWAFVFYAIAADIPNGGISNFFSQLIVGFGYTPEQSLLYGTPAGAVEVVALLLNGFLGDYYQQRILVSSGGLLVAILGTALVLALPETMSVGRLVGYYLTLASPTPFVCILGLISSNVAGYTKKTTVAALYLIGYCVGNIIGPQTFRPEQAPEYTAAKATIIACFAACLVDMYFIWWWYNRQNAKKAQIRAEPGYSKVENQEWLDLTDKENAEFTYSV